MVTVEDSVLIVTSPNGLASKIEVFDSVDGPESYTVIETSGASLTSASPSCRQVSASRVSCRQFDISALTLDLGDGADLAKVFASVPTLFDLGPGSDNAFESPADDIMFGGGGNDIFRLGSFAADADWIVGDDGFDTVEYSASTAGATITLDGRPNDGPAGGQDMIDRRIERVIGSEYNDTLLGNGLSTTFLGLGGQDVISGRGGNDVLEGDGGNDVLDGGAGSDSLIGDDDNDTLIDGGGTGDILSGGLGVDRANYSSRTFSLIIDLDDVADDGEPGENDNVKTDIEILQAGAGADTLTGSSGNNTLIGGVSKDTLIGLGGNDILVDQATGANTDVLVGGTGTDLADFSSYDQDLNISLDGVANDGPGESPTGNVHSDVENVIAGPGDDTVSGSALANTLDGGLGSDTLNGGEGADRLRDGGGNGDALLGGTGVDVVDYSGRTAGLTITPNGVADDGTTGGGENDNVGADVERLVGGFGNDVISGNGLNNMIYGGNGNDSINAGDGNDIVLGENGNDQLNGGAGTDTVNGGLHDDRLVDGRGTADVLIGGAGFDFADYAYRTDSLTITLDNVANDGGSGENDNVDSDVEKVTTGTGSDTVTGSGLNNSLNGGPGNDTLRGLGGDDTLDGGAGNDTVDGGDGTDTANGGDGTDTCTAETTTGCP